MSIHTVMIADDDQDLLQALSLCCRRLGLNVRTADNSLDLAHAMQEAPPSLMCIDVQMPCGTGLSVCEKLASDADYAHVPLIIMSGNCDSETIRRCWRLNAHFVLKHADIWTKLEPLIRNLLQLPAEEAVVSHRTLEPPGLQLIDERT